MDNVISDVRESDLWQRSFPQINRPTSESFSPRLRTLCATGPSELEVHCCNCHEEYESQLYLPVSKKALIISTAEERWLIVVEIEKFIVTGNDLVHWCGSAPRAADRQRPFMHQERGHLEGNHLHYVLPPTSSPTPADHDNSRIANLHHLKLSCLYSTTKRKCNRVNRYDLDS